MSATAHPLAQRTTLGFLHAFLQAFLYITVGLGWIVIVILLTPAARSEPAAQLTLKPEITVHGERVTLGDVFEAAWRAAYGEVARSIVEKGGIA